jgi:hypothetical protein
LADKSNDSHFQYYGLVRALTNSHVAIDSSPAEVSDALFTFVDIVALNRSIDNKCPIPSHLRHHEQEKGSRTAPLNNIAASELTLSALAAGRYSNKDYYLKDNQIDDTFLLLEDLPPGEISRLDHTVDQEGFFVWIKRVHAYIHNLYRSGLHPAALLTVWATATSTERLNTIHPKDAMHLVRSTDPARFSTITAPAASKLLYAFLHYSRLYDLACGDFIRRYFPDPWIDAYEYWMKPGPEMPPAAPWAVKVDRILDYICKEHNDFMDLHSILEHKGDFMALPHYYAGSVEF